LTEEQYKLLCSYCDAILLDDKSTVERVAIPWLHILNEHPANLDKYVNVFKDDTESEILAVKSLVSTIFKFVTTARATDGWHSSSDIKGTIDVLFFSHLLNKSDIGIQRDFYFGSLLEKCLEQTLSVAMLLHNHSGCKVNSIVGKWPVNMPRILFDSTLSWQDEMSIRFRLKKQSRILSQLSMLTSDEIKRRVTRLASTQALATHSIATLRFFLQAKKLIERIKPKTVVVTYEGHAWERLVFAAARQINPMIRCIGYQHSILYPRQHAAKRTISQNYDPDIILTPGQINTTILLETNDIESLSIVNVGTHRFKLPKSGLLEKLQNETEISCVVIPDGTLSECLTILNFLLKVAGMLPVVKFIIRMHPVMSINKVYSADPKLIKLPNNVKISRRDIHEDFEKSRWVLYRNSSAVINAVIAGARPFYISQSSELVMDPLYRLSIWRIIVIEPLDFVSQVKLDLQSDKEKLYVDWITAKQFCMGYFQKEDSVEFIRQITM
jgi:hypothetical protein